jgi:uncharacterized protein Usg
MLGQKSMLHGYRMTTAEITYCLPDHPSLLQKFIWQNLDIHPDFPELQRFLRYWQKNIDGKLHSVTVAAAELIRPSSIRIADSLDSIH